MNRRAIFSGIVIFACLAVFPVTAGTVVYNNDLGGVASQNYYDLDAWSIFGAYSYTVADSFTLPAPATITGVNFAVWVLPGDTVTSVDWTFRANDGADPLSGTVLASGTANPPSQTWLETNSGYGYNIDLEYFSLPVPLALNANTTYWLQLGNAADSQGNNVFWDQSDGPSAAWANFAGDYMSNYIPENEDPCSSTVACTGSESFQLLSGTVPEPGTLALLGGGLLALGLRRRRQ